MSPVVKVAVKGKDGKDRCRRACRAKAPMIHGVEKSMDGKDGKAPMFHVDLVSSQYFLSLSTTCYEDYHSLIINIL